MSTIQLKEKLHHYINKGDSRLLKMMYALTLQYHADEIVGYKPNGEAMSQAEFRKEIQQIEKEIDRGDFVSLEHLEKEAKKW